MEQAYGTLQDSEAMGMEEGSKQTTGAGEYYTQDPVRSTNPDRLTSQPGLGRSVNALSFVARAHNQKASVHSANLQQAEKLQMYGRGEVEIVSLESEVTLATARR